MSTIQSSAEHLTLNADGTSKDIKLQSNASEKVIIKSTGNVGINNSAPTQRLEINGNSQLNAHDSSSGSGGYSTSGLQIGNAFDAGLSGGNDDRNSIVWNERGLDMLFGTSNTERMRIDYNGNVGIGVTPESWHSNYKALQIGNTGTLFKDNANGGDFSIGNNFYLNSTPAYAYTTTAAASRHSQENGIHYFQVAPSGSADSAITWTNAMTIDNSLMIKLGTNNDTNAGGGIQLRYNNYNDNTGLIGISSPSTSSRDIMVFTNPNGQVGKVVMSGSSTAYNTSSDYRLKENVDYDWDATTRLKQLKPARFNFIADDTNTLVDGFIAHEVSSVVPEAITGQKDAMIPEVLYAEGDDIPEGKSVGDVKTAAAIDPQGIDQSKLVPLLVKTIQELEARITALEA